MQTKPSAKGRVSIAVINANKAVGKRKSSQGSDCCEQSRQQKEEFPLRLLMQTKPTAKGRVSIAVINANKADSKRKSFHCDD